MVASDLALIRRWLDDAMYGVVDYRIGMEAPVSPTGFPRYEVLEPVVSRFDPAQRTLLRLLRLGQTVDHAAVSSAIPGRVLDAFAAAKLLERTDAGEWRTPGLLLVPIEGLLVFVGTPPSYPTAPRPSEVWFDLSSFVVARSIPRSLAGERVLDVCSGSGVQALVCAMRGAASVLGLDISAPAVELARLNASFNGVTGVRFERSDKLAALRQDEFFELIICNTPYAPVIDGLYPPRTLEELGNHVLLVMLEPLVSRLSENGRAIFGLWRSLGASAGEETAQHRWIAERVAPLRLSVSAFRDRAPDTIDGVLRILESDVKARHGAEAAQAAVLRVKELLAAPGAPTAFYNQLLLLQRSERS